MSTGESINYQINTATREIETLIAKIKSFDSESLDRRVHSIILTKLQEARLFSLELIPEYITTVNYIPEDDYITPQDGFWHGKLGFGMDE